MTEKKDIIVKTGDALFKFRSFTPLPVIVLILAVFRPLPIGDRETIYFTLLGLILSLSGELIRMISVGYSHFGTSGRENYLRAEQLNRSGIYSVVRNPLYIGNFMMFSGLLIVYMNPIALMLMGIYLGIQYYFIIRSEEFYLTGVYGDEYTQYRREVNRILPNWRHYRKPVLHFNVKKVLFKENDSLFNLLLMFIIVLMLREYHLSNVGFSWEKYIVYIAILLLFYIGIKVWKKRFAVDLSDRPRVE